MPQLVNVSMIFVVTFVVFPGVAASWAPQLEFFTSKGRWEAVGSSENLSGIVFWRKSDSVLLDISGLFRSSIFFYGLLLRCISQYASFTGKWHFKWFSKVKRCAWIKHAHVWLASIPRRMSSVSRVLQYFSRLLPNLLLWRCTLTWQCMFLADNCAHIQLAQPRQTGSGLVHHIGGWHLSDLWRSWSIYTTGLGTYCGVQEGLRSQLQSPR